MLETFALRLVLGMLLALLVLPIGEVPPRFYRLHLLIALGLVTLAGTVAWTNEAPFYWLALGLAGASCFVGTWFWLGPAHWSGLVPIVLAALATSLALTSSANMLASLMWTLLENGSSAAQIGLALTAMLLGHYYLISPTMSQRPLVRLTLLLMAAIIGRATVSAAGCFALPHSANVGHSHVVRLSWLVLRWLAGLGAALIFAYLAWRCARIRSTQSATGILYAAVISTFLGELAQLLLDNH